MLTYRSPNQLTYPEVEAAFPEAWKALPSSYQNDSCLSFFTDEYGILWANYDLGGTFCWFPKHRKWEELS